MNLNPAAFPTFLLAFALFGVGFYSTSRVQRGTSRSWLTAAAVLLAVPGCLFVLYYTHLFDNAVWFYRFRAAPGTELAAAGLGFGAGVLHCLLRPQTYGEKLIAPLLLVILLTVPFIKSIFDPVDYGHLRRKCTEEVCRQSTPSTCGPTSAATLLRLFGQDASEEELARECFTYRGGTEIWYVARALRRRGLNVDFVIQPRDQISPPAPAIAGVVLPGGAGHFIAILSENADQIIVGDPLKGKRIIPRTELDQSYHFTGFFLLIRGRRPDG